MVGQIIIENQDDYDAINKDIPQYAIVNCSSIRIYPYNNKYHHYLNNWDFSRCDTIEFCCIKNMKINNDTLQNARIAILDSKNITAIGYRIVKLSNCSYCHISSKCDIGKVLSCSYVNCTADMISNIEDCHFSTLAFTDDCSIDTIISECKNCKFIIDTKYSFIIPENYIVNCICCNIVFNTENSSIVAYSTIASGMKHCRINFKGFLLNGAMSFIQGEMNKYFIDDDCEFVKKNE